MNQSQEIIEALGEAGNSLPGGLKKGDTVTVDTSKLGDMPKPGRTNLDREIKKGKGKVKVVGMVFGKIMVSASGQELGGDGTPAVPPAALKKA